MTLDPDFMRSEEVCFPDTEMSPSSIISGPEVPSLLVNLQIDV